MGGNEKLSLVGKEKLAIVCVFVFSSHIYVHGGSVYSFRQSLRFKVGRASRKEGKEDKEAKSVSLPFVRKMPAILIGVLFFF